MAKASSRAKNKKITVTLEIEPPYTSFAVLTFGGGKDGGVALTSAHMALRDKSVVYIGENGGVQELTGAEAKRRHITSTTNEKGNKEGDSDD